MKKGWSPGSGLEQVSVRGRGRIIIYSDIKKKKLLSSDISKAYSFTSNIFPLFSFRLLLTYVWCGGMRRERGVVEGGTARGGGFFSLDYLVLVVRSYGFHK